MVADGQQKRFLLNVDAVRNVYGLPVVVAPYLNLRNLSQKLQGATTYDQHKHKGGTLFMDVTPTL